MRSHLLANFILLLAGVAMAAPPLQDPWTDGHNNASATGAHVLGCWKFDDMPLADASGHGTQLILAGAVTNAQGRFGGGLTCRATPVSTRYSALTAPSIARLSPAGAFSADMWVRVTMEKTAHEPAHLLDKQGATLADYRWSLQPADESGMRRMVVSLGFGTFTKEFVSDPVLLPAGEWRHLAFNYDGAGRVNFFIGTTAAGSVFAERCGAVQPGVLALSIGDGHHTYYGFPGDLDEVRLCDGVRGYAAFALQVVGSRHVWERYERGTPLKIICTNLRAQKLAGAGLMYTFAGRTQDFILPDLPPGGLYETEFGPDTAMKAGDYQLEVVMRSGDTRLSQTASLRIVPRATPAMPVIMQGTRLEDLPRLRELACTHWLGLTNEDDVAFGPHGRSRAHSVQPQLEAGLAAGLRVVAALSPWRFAQTKPEMMRTDREGKPFEPWDLDAASPYFSTMYGHSAQRFTTAYRECMTWSGTWLNIAPLSKARPGFSTVEREAYRKATRQEIPAEVQDGGGVDWRKLAGFPDNRVVPDDHPILQYYRWFWSGGHGWKAVNDAWMAGFDAKRQERLVIWTLSEPAAHQPAIGGMHGRVNYLADEPLDNRQPMHAGLCADQLLAMSAASARDQGVFGIVPLSWERDSVSPYKAKDTAETIQLVERITPATHITLAPAILNETLWMTLARPVKGLIFTGWPALFTTPGSTLPDRPTHPHTYTVFREFTDRVLKPLGPMLARRQPLRSPVALLESFTSQMFAGRGVYRGASPRTLEVWQALQRGHVPVDIVYEDTLAAGGLDDRQILIMTECDVLPASLVERLRKWQEGGGKILADENLCPGLKADALLSKTGKISAQDNGLARTENEPRIPKDLGAGAAENAGQGVFQDLDKAAALAAAKAAALSAASADSLPQALARMCEGLGWQPRVRCDNPDIILHASRTGDATCLFVINDHREAGNYVGQHGQVQESGLPAVAALNLGSESINVYDLTRGLFVLPKREDQGLTIPLRLGPGEGRVFLLSPSPLLDLTLDLPETAACGNVAEATVKITTSGGRPMPAAIPVNVRIRDADGATAEWDGPNVVEDGNLTLRLQLAGNETPGTWEVRVRELASGIEVVKWMKVSK